VAGTTCYVRGPCAQAPSVCLYFFYSRVRARACTRAPIFASARRGTLVDFNAYFLATNGSDSTYPDPVRPRVPGAPRCAYEYATIKHDLFISMTPEIDPSMRGEKSRALAVEIQDRFAKNPCRAKIVKTSKILFYFITCEINGNINMERNSFAVVSTNLARYRSENNFVELSKWL